MADLLGKLIIERVEDVTALDPATDKLMFIMDEPTKGSLESAMETVWAEGKGGRRLYGLDKNKTAKFTCSNGYLVLAALQAQVGGNITEIGQDGVSAPVIEYITPVSGKLTLTYTPVAGSLKFIYEANSDLTQGTSYELGEDAAAQFSISGSSVTLPTSASLTAVYIAVYDRKATAGFVITNDSEQYAKNAKVIFTILCHDACDLNTKIYTKLIFPNAKIDGNFTLDISGDAVVQELSIEAMADVCSVSKLYWNWIVCE